MSYREHAPAPALAPWVECSWERLGEPGAPVRVVPDGCIDLVWTEGAGTRLVGPNTTAFLVPLAEGTRVAGVRLRPGAAPPVIGVGADALCDDQPLVEEVWADAGRRLTDRLETTDDPLAALLAAVAGRASSAHAPDPLVRAAIARLGSRPGGVARLADELFVSERQLRRRVATAVGYGPKRLARVLRLRRAVAAARAGDDLARVAADAGYADQAHFSGECRELAGVPPSVLLRD